MVSAHRSLPLPVREVRAVRPPGRSGTRTWQFLEGAAEILVEDDRSDRRTLEAVLPSVAARCDILLGPYSTQLMRAAGRIAAESGWLIWNQGGSGDDVEGAHPVTSFPC